MHFRAGPDSLFTAEDYGFDHVEVWPENWPVWRLWLEMATQWRYAGMSGTRTGLDYTPLMARMERMRLSDEDWESTFADIRSMELAAMEQMRDNDK